MGRTTVMVDEAVLRLLRRSVIDAHGTTYGHMSMEVDEALRQHAVRLDQAGKP